MTKMWMLYCIQGAKD